MPVYNYCITSNHVHIIVHVDTADAVASMMQLASATMARHWNRRKNHEGSIWEHPYKCTRIQDGIHLLHCLIYVSMNSVRAGLVKHPDEWRWCAHDELTGSRSRYTMLSLDRLLQSLDISSIGDLHALYESALDDRLKLGNLQREPAWTEALAVGDRQFVEQTATQTDGRYQFVYTPLTGPEAGWAVRDDHGTYDVISASETPANPS